MALVDTVVGNGVSVVMGDIVEGNGVSVVTGDIVVDDGVSVVMGITVVASVVTSVVIGDTYMDSYHKGGCNALGVKQSFLLMMYMHCELECRITA